MGKKIMATLVMAVLAAVLLQAPSAYACSCAEPVPVEEEMEKSAAVFSGKVVKIVDNRILTSMSSDASIGYVFEVEKAWKGVERKEVVVYTERYSASCGYEFAYGEEYIVYATKEYGKLRTTLCSRTASLPSAGQDLAQLGAGKEPLKQASLMTKYRSVHYAPLYVGGIIVLIGLILFIRKRNGRHS